jgi:cytochrome P450
MMSQDTTILRQILDPANRANPWPLWAKLRETPVCWQEDALDDAGAYVVSSYRHVAALFHDPRLSSDERNNRQTAGQPITPDAPSRFISLDPPEHDRLRALAMRHFGPPERPAYLDGLRPEIERTITEMLDRLVGNRRFDFAESFAYPLPVTIICRILGVPPEDEPQFKEWASAVIETIAQSTEPARHRREQAVTDLSHYIGGLIERDRKHPGDDLLSRMATDDGPAGRMTDAELISTRNLLLIAGHETTVDLLSNGLLILLRNPAMLERLREEPDLIAAAVEEMLRLEPPVQFLRRTTLYEIELAETTIPEGALVALAIAAANRDPARFSDPDRFDPDRCNNQHLGFGSGIHACFGAPLARIEAQIAFTQLAQRLVQPRLLVDPPPYRPSPLLRGPEHLPIEVAEVRATAKRLIGAA